MVALEIPNRQARWLWLQANGLAQAPTGPVDVMGTIHALGFVQIDTVRNVTRAHHHILWSRNQNYREGMLWPLLEQRNLFEHFTHDASLLPMEVFPLWRRQFQRLGEKAARGAWLQSGLGRAEIENIRKRIEAEGPLSTHAFDSGARGKEMWARPPHKKALDQMWYAGDLATSHRQNFVKFYDLGERIFPTTFSDAEDDAQAIDKLHHSALNRMAMATPGEVQRFWDATSAAEVRDWIAQAELVPLRVQAADGTWRDSWGAPDIEDRLARLAPPGKRLRLLNPFDPAIQDRTRLERLFGFDYRNEMFVPQAKRRWGYYVYPLLEGDRFVGRVELKADRGKGRMQVTGFWPERRVKWGAARLNRLQHELTRFARLAGVTEVQTHALHETGATL
ncbi:winged helix-turn-helix domain-containing protein [Roseovarius sp. A21]|uniref:Winged helix-turn-helix domain-containing protein n=1 Tax=Roseovarius bejariae TaxID=2576383 RepID=A0A844CYK2_9RHOB|nr:crosslink repair DNA glycosylase YcaQ family protein [Roseovarius bejariae]MRU15114.1 winged helix-turn-helix domain-containing protein [Roseovarius bejariae]